MTVKMGWRIDVRSNEVETAGIWHLGRNDGDSGFQGPARRLAKKYLVIFEEFSLSFIRHAINLHVVVYCM